MILEDLFEGVTRDGKRLVINGSSYNPTDFKKDVLSLLKESTNPKAGELRLQAMDDREGFMRQARVAFEQALVRLTAPELDVTKLPYLPAVDFKTGQTYIMNMEKLRDPKSEASEVFSDRHPDAF